MRKFACILGVLVSIAMIALGVLVTFDGLFTVDFNDGVDINDLNFSGSTVSSTTFGADFYTYSYRGTRAAANNVDSLGDYLEGCAVTLSSIGLIVGGLFGLLLSMYGLGVNKAIKQELALLDKISSKRRAAGAPASETAAAPAAASAAAVSAAAPAASAAPRSKEVREKPSVTVESTWICQTCGHINPDSRKSCDMCGRMKLGVGIGDTFGKEKPAEAAAPSEASGHAAAPAPVVEPAPAVAPAPMPVFDSLESLELVAVQPAKPEEKPAPVAPEQEDVCISEVLMKPAAAVRRTASLSDWTCPVCAMENAPEQPECICCGTQKPSGSL